MIDFVSGRSLRTNNSIQVDYCTTDETIDINETLGSFLTFLFSGFGSKKAKGVGKKD